MRRVPLHPFLLALYPVLFLYQHNLGEVRGSQVLVPAGAALGLAALAMLVSWVAVRRWRTAGLIASAFVVFFFSYGHLADFVSGRAHSAPVGQADWLWALLWLGVFLLAAVILAGRRGELRAATGFLNLLAAVLVTSSLVRIAPHVWRQPPREHLVPAPTATRAPEPLPDIYYIVLDSYGGNRALKEFFSYDNREFLTFLKSRGFYVVENGETNYPYTAASLASSLNMCYLEALTPNGVKPDARWSPPHVYFRDHAVQRFLKERGYRYIHLGSWWEETRVNGEADENLVSDRVRLTEFESLLAGTTLARPVLALFSMQDLPHRERRITLYQFEQLETMGRRPGPKLVFAHLIVPHHPYVFDASGRMPAVGETANVTQAYVQQLQYTNRRTAGIVDRILAESKAPPIIILQGDHGPLPTSSAGEGDDLPDDTGPYDRCKVSILNAYYLPGGKTNKLYPTITPVNTFRLIFGEYFGADCPLLPDRPWRTDEHGPRAPRRRGLGRLDSRPGGY